MPGCSCGNSIRKLLEEHPLHSVQLGVMRSPGKRPRTRNLHDPGVDKQFKPRLARTAQPFRTRWQRAVASSPSGRAAAAVRPLAGATVLAHKRANSGNRTNRVVSRISNVQENLPLHRSSPGKPDVNVKGSFLLDNLEVCVTIRTIPFPVLRPYNLTDKYFWTFFVRVSYTWSVRFDVCHASIPASRPNTASWGGCPSTGSPQPSPSAPAGRPAIV